MKLIEFVFADICAKNAASIDRWSRLLELRNANLQARNIYIFDIFNRGSSIWGSTYVRELIRGILFHFKKMATNGDIM